MAFVIELVFELAAALLQGAFHLAWGLSEGRPVWQRVLLAAGVVPLSLGVLLLFVVLVGSAVNALRTAGA